MNYKEVVENAIEYIESNLKSELSLSNLTKAVGYSQYHFLPTEYKSSGNSLKLYDRFCLDMQQFCVTPEIITLSDFSLTVYPSDEDYAPKLLNKYNCNNLSLRLSGGYVCEDFVVNRWDNLKNRLSYWVGIRTEEVKGDTTGTVCLNIDCGLYAVFNTPTTSQYDFVNTIHRTWEYISQKWLPKSKYQCANGYQFESYVEESRTFSEKIYIPIEMRKC